MLAINYFGDINKKFNSKFRSYSINFLFKKFSSEFLIKQQSSYLLKNCDVLKQIQNHRHQRW